MALRGLAIQLEDPLTFKCMFPPVMEWERQLSQAFSLKQEVLRYTLCLFASVLVGAGISAFKSPTGTVWAWHNNTCYSFVLCCGARLWVGAAASSFCSCVISTMCKTNHVAARHLYSMLSGCILIYCAFGAGITHVLLPSTLTYLAMALAPRRCGTLSWAINLVYLQYV
jgi:hypothetical protein